MNEGDGIEVLPEYREYTYDNIGNRWDAVDWNAASGDYRTTAYTANSLNQYEDQVAAGGATETYDYDEDGNLVLASDGSYDTIYTYNAENRLTAVEPASPVHGDKKVEASYDYMGRRIQKVVSSWNGSDWTINKEILFVYDGWNLIEEI